MPSSSKGGQDDSERVSRPVPSLYFLLLFCSRVDLYVCIGACVSLLPVQYQSNLNNIYTLKYSFAHLRKFTFSGFIATLYLKDPAGIQKKTAKGVM